jgi:predicted phage terminase large subunit-like protein
MTATLTAWEAAARMFEPPVRRWATPGELARQLNPKTIQTPALDLIDRALVDVLDQPDGRLIISMPPQEGKSTRILDFVTWALTQNPDLRALVTSYGDALARRNGRQIRDRVVSHPELGLSIRDDVAAQGEWQLDGHDGGVYAAGIGTALTGRPGDLLVIDDPIKDRTEADSETYRQRVWDWWTDVASTRLAPGAPVVVILTRWHEDDLAGRLLAAEDGHLWRCLNIPAQADHDPLKDQTDPLGREPGQFMVSARGARDWPAIKIRSGSRTWASLYQGHPAPTEGDLFKRDWWQRYDQQLWVERPDGSRLIVGADSEDLLASWDMTFKDTAGTDYVVGQVWLRRGADAYLLDQVRGRMDFVETCRQFRALSARWPQVILKVVEDKANGPAVIAALRRVVPGIVPEEPQGSKESRASAVTPLVEAGNVYLPVAELAPWADDLIDEAAAFPAGAHDDQVDAMSQALNRLILQPLLAGDLDEVEPDEFTAYDQMGWSITP